jgi:hypothetical protein
MRVPRPRRSASLPAVAALAAAAVLVVAVGPVLAGGRHARVVARAADVNCFKSFKAGSGGSLFKACVSNEGNVNTVMFPKGITQLTTGEGYAICSGADTENHHGWDQGLTEAGLAAANTTSTSPLTIVRSTTDGHFQLTQTFMFDGAEHDIDITMKLKNVGATTLDDVKLTRSFDADIDGSATGSRWARTDNSVWGWNDSSGNGLMLSTRGSSWGTFTDTLVMLQSAWTSTPSTLGGSANCEPVGFQATPTTDLTKNYAGELIFNLGTMAPGDQKTVSVRYGQM